MKGKRIRGLLSLTLVFSLLCGGCSFELPRDSSSATQGQSSEKVESSSETESEKNAEDASVDEGKDNYNPREEINTIGIEPIDWDSKEGPSVEQLIAASYNYDFSEEFGDSIEFNGLGVQLHANDIRVRTLNDVITGETKYFTAYYKEYYKEKDGYYKVTMKSCLYDTNAKMVSDWKEVQYTDALGEWVLARNYFDINYSDEMTNEGYLYNPHNKETLDKVEYITRLSNNRALVNKTEGGLFYILDENGYVVFDGGKIADMFSMDVYVYNVGKYVVLVDGDYGSYNIYICDSNGAMVATIYDTQETSIATDKVKLPYFICDSKAYDLRQANGGELKPIDLGNKPLYYDDEVAILDESDEYGNGSCYMIDSKTKKVISDKYNFFETEDKYYYSSISDDNELPQYFYFVDDQGIKKLDRKGQIVAQVDIPNVDGINVYKEGVFVDSDDYTSYSCYELDLTPIPIGKYATYRPIYQYGTKVDSTCDIWLGTYTIPANGWERDRIDIMTKDGKVIFQGATSVRSMTDGRIPVKKGRSIGVIDTEGNWIFKYNISSFTNAD